MNFEGVWTQGDTPGENRLLVSARDLSENAATSFNPAINARLAALRNPGAEKGASATRAAADAAQRTAVPAQNGVGRGPSLAGLVTRAGALARVSSFGDQAVEKQNLQDRIAMLRGARGIRNNSYTGQQQIAENEAMLARSQIEANTITKNAQANMWGSMAGAAVGYGVNAFNQPGWNADPKYAQQLSTYSPTINGGPTLNSSGLDWMNDVTATPMMKPAVSYSPQAFNTMVG